MRHALALVLALAATPVFAQDAPTPPHQRPAVFVLSGEGIVSATPDMAVLRSGVVTEAKTAREALDANTAAMTKLIASFKEAGIQDRDVATSGFTVQPRYVYDKRSDGSQQPPRIAGYEVRNTVTVRVRGLEKLGAVLDSAVTEGSNQIDSLSFDVSEKAGLLQEARKKALADARAKAEVYAEAAGVTLGRLRELTEQRHDGFVPRPMMRMEAASAAPAPVPIEAGEQDIRVNVTTTWEIAP